MLQKYDEISKFYLTLLSKLKKSLEISPYFCGLLRMYELYWCYFKYEIMHFNPNQNLVHTLALERATFSLSLEANINLLIVVLLYVFYIAP